MAVIAGVVTTDARIYWPQMFGGLQTFHQIDLIKVGEGGWIDPGGGRVRRTPDPNLRRLDTGVQDIDAIVDATRAVPDQRYAADERGSFEKALTALDFTFESPSVLRVRVALDFGEFNDDGFANDPEIWEVGIFSDHPRAGIELPAGTKLMVGYATFPQETKDSSVQLENIVRLIF